MRTIRLFGRFLPAAALLAALLGMVVRLASFARPRAERHASSPVEPLVQIQPGLSYHDLRRAIFFGIRAIVLIWVGVWFIGRVLDVLTLLSLSLVLAVAIRPAVDRLSSDRIPYLNRTVRRALAILTIYLGIATALATIGLIVVPQVAVEAEKLVTKAPDYMQQVDQQLSTIPGLSAMPPVSSLTNQVAGQMFANLPQALGVLVLAISTVTSLLSIGVVLVLTFFLIMDADAIYKHFTALVPPAHRGRTREMTAKMGRKIEGWLRGIIVLSVTVGIGTGLGMWFLGMPYPLLLGVTASIVELVPLAGPYLASAPGIALALFQPTWKLIAVILFFVGLQLAENNILAPTVMGREVELPPLLVIVALMIGASMLGLLGALLALPVVAVIHVLWTDLVVPEIKRRYVENGQTRT